MTEHAQIGISVRCDNHDFSDLAAGLDAAEELGVDTVEIPTLSMDLVANGRMLRERVHEVAAILKGRPLKYTVHGPIAINLMDEPWRLPLHEEVLAASLEVAAELGALHYIMHTGIVGDVQGAGFSAALAQQREALLRAADVVRKFGLLITVENVFTYNHRRETALPSVLAAEVEALDSEQIRACFDVSHGYINATLHGADFLAEAEALARFAKHVHVHDSFGRPHDIPTYSRAERLAFGQGDVHLPVGWGSIPWDALMARCTFPRGTIFNIELEQRYWEHAAETVARTRALIDKAQLA